MSARIEVAEVLSFRLKVPKPELERLPRQLSSELGVVVETEGNEWVVSVEEGDSILRFRTIGTEAVLTEVVLCNDERGLFFTRVLGPLMVRHGGDLNARLTWNVAERNTEGDFAEVKIARGQSNYPGLGSPMASLPPATAQASSMPGPGGGGPVNVMAVGDGAPEPQPTPEQREVQVILERARGHWEEYQRLKAAKGGK